MMKLSISIICFIIFLNSISFSSENTIIGNARVIDADTIVHPDCPNFFLETNHEFSSALCNGDYEWVNRAIHGYSRLFFDCDYYKMSSDFFQTCFVILNEKHRDFLKNVVDWYWENKDQVIQSYDIVKCGSDQPLINLLTKE